MVPKTCGMKRVSLLQRAIFCTFESTIDIMYMAYSMKIGRSNIE